jgi:pimeloyl-ACP methyl ester carboxylesterase
MKLYSWKQLEQSFIEDRAIRKSMIIGGSKIYYLTNIQPIIDPTDTYICIHGIASSSLVYLKLIQQLPKGSQFFFIDLPGFGKSNVCELHQNQDYFEYATWCLNAFMNELNISSARWIAHSFGTFFSILFAHSYPDRVKSLVLVAPVGLMPVGGYNYWYIGVLFKTHFPYFLKWFRLFIFFLYRLGWKREYWRYLFYYLACYSDVKSKAGNVFSSCMTPASLFSGYWNRPVLDKLISIPKPVTLIYGEEDPIIPYHQGWIVQALRQETRLKILRGRTHRFVEQIPDLLIECANVDEPPVSVDISLVEKVSEIIQTPARYVSSISYHWTWVSIQKLYLELLSLLQD